MILVLVVATAFVPILVAVAVTALVLPNAVADRPRAVLVIVVVLVGLAWIVLGQIVGVAAKVLLVGIAGASLRPRWLTIAEAAASWVVLAALLRLVVFDLDAAAVVAATVAVLAYQALEDPINRLANRSPEPE